MNPLGKAMAKEIKAASSPSDASDCRICSVSANWLLHFRDASLRLSSSPVSLCLKVYRSGHGDCMRKEVLVWNEESMNITMRKFKDYKRELYIFIIRRQAV